MASQSWSVAFFHHFCLFLLLPEVWWDEGSCNWWRKACRRVLKMRCTSGCEIGSTPIGHLSSGRLVDQSKEITGCEGRRDHMRQRMRVKWFEHQGTDPVEYNCSKKSTLWEVCNDKNIKQAEELNLPPSYLSGLTNVSSIQDHCRVGNKVIRRALVGSLVMTLMTALRIWNSLCLVRIMNWMPRCAQCSSVSEIVVIVGEGCWDGLYYLGVGLDI